MKKQILSAFLVLSATVVGLGVALAPAAAAKPATTWTLQECYKAKPILRPRSNNTHPCVVQVQRLLATPHANDLNGNGYNPGPVDGIYGKKTKDAVKRFQADFNTNMATTCGQPRLLVDGIVGKYTWRALKCAYGTNDGV